MSDKTLISIKIDRNLKKQASSIAEEMGFNLSSVIASTLRNFVDKRELHISLDHKPTPYLERIIKDSEKEYKNNKKLRFSNSKEAMAFLLK